MWLLAPHYSRENVIQNILLLFLLKEEHNALQHKLCFYRVKSHLIKEDGLMVS